jgi:hypothetical protein
LTQLVADTEENGGRRLAAPYRRDWQRAVNQLAAACMQEGVVPPGELVAVPPGGVALVVWSCVLWARLRPAELPVSLPLAS